jgi:hypothetical protein
LETPSFKVGPGFAKYRIQPLDEAEGRKLVTQYKLSGDNVFELEMRRRKE